MSTELIVDLTHPVGSGTEGYPGDPGLTTRTVHSYPEQGYLVSEVTTGSHVGTHIDAPLHVFENGTDVSALDLTALVGPAVVVDVGPLEPGAEIPHEALTPHLLPGARILVKTGWSRHFGSPRYHQGYPGISLELARAIADAGVALIGLEQPSVHESDGLAVHHVILGAGCLIVEGLKLDGLAHGTWDLCCLPLPLVGVDGSPVRAVARRSRA